MSSAIQDLNLWISATSTRIAPFLVLKLTDTVALHIFILKYRTYMMNISAVAVIIRSKDVPCSISSRFRAQVYIKILSPVLIHWGDLIAKGTPVSRGFSKILHFIRSSRVSNSFLSHWCLFDRPCLTRVYVNVGTTWHIGSRSVVIIIIIIISSIAAAPIKWEGLVWSGPMKQNGYWQNRTCSLIY
jgi:hypothetical protein